MPTVYNVDHSPQIIPLDDGHIGLVPGAGVEVDEAIAADLLAPGRGFSTDEAEASRAATAYAERLAGESQASQAPAIEDEPEAAEVAPVTGEDESGDEPKPGRKPKTDKENQQ